MQHGPEQDEEAELVAPPDPRCEDQDLLEEDLSPYLGALCPVCDQPGPPCWCYPDGP